MPNSREQLAIEALAVFDTLIQVQKATSKFPSPYTVHLSSGVLALIEQALVALREPEPATSLDHLRALQPGWDSYGAKVITEAAIRTAETITSNAPLVVPTSAGGIQIEWHVNGIDFEIVIGPDGREDSEYLRGAKDLAERLKKSAIAYCEQVRDGEFYVRLVPLISAILRDMAGPNVSIETEPPAAPHLQSYFCNLRKDPVTGKQSITFDGVTWHELLAVTNVSIDTP